MLLIPTFQPVIFYYYNVGDLYAKMATINSFPSCLLPSRVSSFTQQDLGWSGTAIKIQHKLGLEVSTFILLEASPHAIKLSSYIHVKKNQSN